VSLLACADDITLTDGTVFKDAHIVGHDDKSVTIRFATGVAMVDISKVPVPLIEYYDVKRDLNSAVPPSASAPAPVAAAPSDNFPIVTLDPKSKAIVDNAYVAATEQIERIVPAQGIIGTVVLKFIRLVTTPHSEAGVVDTVPEGLGHTPVTATELKTWTTTESKTDPIPTGVSFIECDTKNCVIGDLWSGKVWMVGTYQFTDNHGIVNTLPKYTTRVESAYRYYKTYPDRLAALPTVLHEEVAPTMSPVSTKSNISISPMQ
jgi:hypothetical protein